MAIRLCIFGSRDFTDYAALCRVIEATSSFKSGDVVEIVSGTAKGADLLGERFARDHGIPIRRFPAQWEDLEAPGARIVTRPNGTRYNKLAGMARNADMAAYCTHAIGFWDGRSPGTSNMVRTCRQAGKPTLVWNDARREVNVAK